MIFAPSTYSPTSSLTPSKINTPTGINDDLLLAVNSKDIEEVKKVLQRNSSKISEYLQRSDAQGQSPLMLATRMGDDDIVDLLLHCNHQLTDKQREGELQTCLLVSSQLGYGEVVRSLCTALDDVNCRDQWGNTPLMLAAAGGHELIVNALIFKGADVDATNKRKQSALTEAVAGGNLEMTAMLLSKAEAHGKNAKIQIGNSIFDLASIAELCKNTEMISLLEGHGIGKNNYLPDQESVDRDNISTYFHRQFSLHDNPRLPSSSIIIKEYQLDQPDNSRIAKATLSSSYKKERYFDYLFTRDNLHGMHEAIIFRNTSKIKEIIITSPFKLENDPQTSKRNFQSAIILAAENGNDTILDILLASDHKFTDAERKSILSCAFMIAASLGHGELMRSMRMTLGTVDFRDDRGNSPLMQAVSGGHDEIANALIFYGADVNATNKYQQSALTEAVASGNLELTAMLLSKDPSQGKNTKIQIGLLEYDLWSIAELRNNSKMISLLEGHGLKKNIYSPDFDAMTKESMSLNSLTDFSTPEYMKLISSKTITNAWEMAQQLERKASPINIHSLAQLLR